MALAEVRNVVKSLGVYVINLKSRPDRLAEVSAQLSERAMDFTRVEACTPEDTNFPNLTSGVGAIYRSHTIAMKHFLDSKFDFALILEDDACLDREIDFYSLVNRIESKFDFIQVGFLRNNLTDFIEVFYFNLRRTLILKGFILARKLFGESKLVLEATNRLVIKEHLNFPSNWVCSNIQAGAHAYIISRNFATKTLELATNPFLAMDDFYMALGRMRLLAMYRLKRSKVSQSDLGSDVLNRFKLNPQD